LKTVEVNLQDRSYRVVVGKGLLGRLDCIGEFAEAVCGRQVFAVSDKTVHGLYGKTLEKCMRPAMADFLGWSIFEPGEEHKTVATLVSVWDDLVRSGMDRKGVIVALGGGVVGDIAGFAAATYLRGVDFIQIPTTLLAMVDSSVGGKTGVDHPLGKNLLGAFHQPRAVLADIDLLSTLPRREVLGGLAEVIKAAILADEWLFSLLEARGPGVIDDPEMLEEVIAKAVSIKAGIVAVDEREGGPRALLNLGHTFGHAVEVSAGYGKYIHGEAVAMGLDFSARLAEAVGSADQASIKRIQKLLSSWGYPGKPEGITREEIKSALGHDKKNSGGVPRWVLPVEIGRARWGCKVSEEIIDALLKEGLDS
jgi:3-dehydroquinate synthase